MKIQSLAEVDVREVASQFIESKIGSGEGVGYYIRPDVSYTLGHRGTELILRLTRTGSLVSPMSTLVSSSTASK